MSFGVIKCLQPLTVTVGYSLMLTWPLVKCSIVSVYIPLSSCVVFNCGFVFTVKSSNNVASKMLDVIGYFTSQLAMVNINSLASGSYYSQPCVTPFLPHEEEVYDK